MSQAKSSASFPLSVQVRVPMVSVSVIAKLSMFAEVPSATLKVVVPVVKEGVWSLTSVIVIVTSSVTALLPSEICTVRV